MPNVRSILEEWLEAKGFAGLYNPGECCCEIGKDFAPCDANMLDCEPGYKTACDPEICGEDHEFHISAERMEVKP